MESNNPICAKCIMTSTTPGIHFDDNGVCNYCSTYVPMAVYGEEKLVEQLNSFRDKNRKYDCLLGISGGRDSTYALWKLVKDYKMRVLAFNYDSPFTSEQARINLHNALEILGVECIKFQLPDDIHRKGTIKALKAWRHRPSSIMIPYVCSYCKTLDTWYYNIAREKKIPLIIIGSNPLETASFKKAGFGGARTYHRLSNLPNIIVKALRELVLNPHYLYSCSWLQVIRMYLEASHSSPYMRWKYKEITELRLFDYIKWNEKEVLSTIEKHLRWQKAPKVPSYWRFDCRLDYARRLMYASTVGTTELRDLFSKMVREGQMTREEALERIKKEDPVPQDEVDNILGELGFKLSDLNLEIDKGLLI